MKATPLRPLTEAERQFVAEHVRLATYAAKVFSRRYCGRVPFDELQAEAAMRLCVVLLKYDASRGALTTFAVKSLVRHLARFTQARHSRDWQRPAQLSYVSDERYVDPVPVHTLRQPMKVQSADAEAIAKRQAFYETEAGKKFWADLGENRPC